MMIIIMSSTHMCDECVCSERACYTLCVYVTQQNQIRNYLRCSPKINCSIITSHGAGGECGGDAAAKTTTTMAVAATTKWCWTAHTTQKHIWLFSRFVRCSPEVMAISAPVQNISMQRTNWRRCHVRLSGIPLHWFRFHMLVWTCDCVCVCRVVGCRAGVIEPYAIQSNRETTNVSSAWMLQWDDYHANMIWFCDD